MSVNLQMVNSGWWSTMLLLWMGLGLASAYNECLLGFELYGQDAFDSTDWIGMSVCDGSLVAAEVTTNACIDDRIYGSCYWSVVDCDSDTSCTCQSCGGLITRFLDDYMEELPIWDRLRCVVFALDAVDFDVTPCVEAIVDTMSMPGVDEEWTPPSVSSLECIALEDDYYADLDACSYPGSARSVAEVFSDGLTPAPSAGVAPVTTSPPTGSSTPSPSALTPTVAPTQSVMTPAPEMIAVSPTVAPTQSVTTPAPEMIIAVPPAAAPEVVTPAPTPGATESPSGSDPQMTPAPSPAGSPTRGPALETGAPIDGGKTIVGEGTDVDDDGGEDDDLSIGAFVGIIVSSVVALLLGGGLAVRFACTNNNILCCIKNDN